MYKTDKQGEQEKVDYSWFVHLPMTHQQGEHNNDKKTRRQSILHPPTVPSGIKPIEKIEDERLSKTIQKFLLKKRIEKPTEIQRLCWPAMLKGLNVVATAPTGSGKTFGFLLPLFMHVENIEPKVTASGLNKGPIALVLVPTRELALQITNVAKPFKRLCNVKTVCVCGGVNKEEQVDELKLTTHIVVATPGRLIDLLYTESSKKLISFSRLNYFIFDEADRMLELGFEDQLQEIFTFIYKSKKLISSFSSSSQSLSLSAGDNNCNNYHSPGFNTCMFTATLPKRLNLFVNNWVKHPRINITTEGTLQSIGESQLGVSPTVTQIVHVCAEHKKSKKLIKFLRNTWKKDSKKRHLALVLVFCNKIKTVVYVEQFLKKQDIRVGALHSKMQQEKRKQLLNEFKAGKINVLIATDVAARGLDMKNLEIVVNWDMPSRLEQYVHRIGRTGRQGNDGLGYTFFTRNYIFLAKELIELLESNNQTVDPNLQMLMDEYIEYANGERAKVNIDNLYTDGIRNGKIIKKHKRRSNQSNHTSNSNNGFKRQIENDEGLLMVPTLYSDGAVNLATLPARNIIDDDGWSTSEDEKEYDLDSNNNMNNKSCKNDDANAGSGQNYVKKNIYKKANKLTFSDAGKLRGVSFKDRCWMAGVQGKAKQSATNDVNFNNVEKSNKKRKGKWKKRGKRGGRKHKK
eukprot:g5801.t1